MNPAHLTIKEAAENIAERKISVTELVSSCLKEIEKHNTDLNAYLNIFDDSLEEAKKKDEELSGYPKKDSPQIPSLFGIPIAVKDNILVKDKICTAGSKILENFVAPYDATVISKLKKHGAILIGKTNLDEFAMGSSTENSAFGPTKNPHDSSRVAGGSSGGSAAAVAANMCLGALGSDTGGSIRQPASFCGTVGFKPTYGTVSRHGLIAMASSLDQIGPLTKTVDDAEIIYKAISGGDDFDSTSVKNLPLPSKKERKDLVFGIPKEYFSEGLDPEVEKKIRKTIEKMKDAGVAFKEISLPSFEYALAAYYVIVPAEISANLARYDGIRYGFSHQEAKNLLEVYNKSRHAGFGDEVKRRIMLGTYTLSAGYYDAYYIKAQKVRRVIKEGFARAFEEIDLLLGPTTSTTAFQLGENTKDPLKMYLADIYTVAVNLAGLPAISIPAGKIGNLPVGLQLIGKWFEEENIFEAAKFIEKLITSR
ncbi:MAG: Asp-tRNA(Asn)/Glu-tRNA(Gln) amidotransferase subunit GatA [bacterium]|nr:Asp-tRNA(Asn)/Glu-tRNA(Gln) amidotransferase subunit GatA [bacterium]